MPIFEYKCAHGHITETQHATSWTDCSSLNCFNIARRVYGFNILRVFPEHFNNSVNAHVSSERTMKDELARAAERNSRESGFDSDYQYLSPSDMADRATHDITEEGMNETRRRAHDSAIQ